MAGGEGGRRRQARRRRAANSFSLVSVGKQSVHALSLLPIFYVGLRRQMSKQSVLLIGVCVGLVMVCVF